MVQRARRSNAEGDREQKGTVPDEEEEEDAASKARLDRLQEELLALRAECDTLSRRNTELREAVGAFNASDLVTASCLADNVLSQTRLELEEKIHRFYGVTLFEPDRPDRLVENYRVKEEQLERVPAPPVIGLRFETFHNGRFGAPQYIIMHVLSVEPPKLALYQHTLPSFMPLACLADQYLNTDFAAFCRIVRRHIVAYHLRRLDLDACEQMASVVEILADEAVEFIELACRHQDRIMRVYVQYRDINMHKVLILDDTGSRQRILEHRLRAHSGLLSQCLRACQLAQ